MACLAKQLLVLLLTHPLTTFLDERSHEDDDCTVVERPGANRPEPRGGTSRCMRTRGLGSTLLGCHRSLRPVRADDWPVVQLAERLALDQEVAGSKPARPAPPPPRYARWRGINQIPVGVCWPGVGFTCFLSTHRRRTTGGFGHVGGPLEVPLRAPVDLHAASSAVIIDVRTPREFASGHFGFSDVVDAGSLKAAPKSTGLSIVT